MNEILQLFHIAAITLSALTALYIGKEALVAYICTVCILANLFVTKQIMLFGMTATTADALAVGITIGLNLLQEYHGQAITKKTIWISFGACLFYTLMTQFQLGYIPTSFDSMHTHFSAILGSMPRIICASFISYIIAQQTDCRLFGFLKKRCNGNYFILRNYVSVGICQLLDTVLFTFLGLYGIVDNPWQIIIVSYTIKWVVIVTSTPFLWASKRIITKESLNERTI